MNLKLNLTSAGGLLALLDEPQSQVQGYALEKLNDVVDVFWAEIADAVGKIEVSLFVVVVILVDWPLAR